MAAKKASQFVIGGSPLPNIPWEDRPASCDDVIWRSARNPIIPRNLIPCANSIFNSAVVPYQGKFAGVFRIDDRRRNMQLHAGFSDDGVNWTLKNERIEFIPENPRVKELGKFVYGYDPRVVKIGDRYWVTWCNSYNGPTIGVGYTKDFKKFYQLDNAFLPYNRNGVLFPRKINGKYVMLSRPSDTGHTPFGDIFLSESPDMVYWGCHRHVMSKGGGWSWTKIGAGPIPIETKEGWLLIYHGVLQSCNGFVYSFGAAILDIDQPWKVLYRGAPYLISPQMTYECVGDVPNVTFPCATLVDAATNRMAIYYGGADTVVCLAYAYVDQIVEWVKKNAV